MPFFLCNKAPGPDDFNPDFYQFYWSVVGNDIFHFVSDALHNCILHDDVHLTNIVLIPKSKHASKITEYRPITLCNVLYRILAKVLATRLKCVLSGLVSKNRSAFVSGRLITDNVLIAYEVVIFCIISRREMMGGCP